MLTTAITDNGLQLYPIRHTQYDRLSQQHLSILFYRALQHHHSACIARYCYTLMLSVRLSVCLCNVDVSWSLELGVTFKYKVITRIDISIQSSLSAGPKHQRFFCPGNITELLWQLSLSAPTLMCGVGIFVAFPVTACDDVIVIMKLSTPLKSQPTLL